MIKGVWGHPYLDLGRYFARLEEKLAELDDEICLALASQSLEYTGGSHRTLGIVPPSLPDSDYVDYGEVISRLDHREFARFVSLSDTPGEFDLSRFREYTFGEEADHPLSKRQMRYLKYRHRVYFPWQVFYEMIPTENWADKSTGSGKQFTEEAKRSFPKTLAFVRSLPFAEIGRCNILGLDPDHHGTVHQDGDINDTTAEHFITLCPRKDKRVFLWDESRRERVYVKGHAYWFNDHDYHGVASDPFFRYSLRIDGVFTDAFLSQLMRDFPRPTPPPQSEPADVGILQLPASRLLRGELPALKLLQGRLALKFSSVLTADECQSLVRSIYAGRAEWTSNFDDVQYTLGRAYYTHLEQDKEDEYFAQAAASDAAVRRAAPGLQERMQALIESLVQAPVSQRPDFCGAGVHIFPAGGDCAQHGGDLHFDVEGLSEEALESAAPALTCVLMLGPPESGGELAVWNRLYTGEAIIEKEDVSQEAELCSYAAGDLVVIDSRRLHQIMPFLGPKGRISATLHAVYIESRHRWEVWF